MAGGIRRFLSVATAIAVATHTVLWTALAPLAASSAVDPFTVICHSETSIPAEQTPAPAPFSPGHACDHCNLCSAAAPPLTPDTILTTRFMPVRILQVLRPANFARHDNDAADPKLARGPPAFA
jgi:hypothetical protein